MLVPALLTCDIFRGDMKTKRLDNTHEYYIRTYWQTCKTVHVQNKGWITMYPFHGRRHESELHSGLFVEIPPSPRSLGLRGTEETGPRAGAKPRRIDEETPARFIVDVDVSTV